VDSKKAGGYNRTQRILIIYFILLGEDIKTGEQIDPWSVEHFPWSKRTFSRDIDTLKKAGVKITYSKKRKCYTLTDRNFGEPNYPDGKAEARFLNKIVRLVTLVRDIPGKDCDVWYMENIPNATKRTMQRDFATLNSIGYNIAYERRKENEHRLSDSDDDFDLPIRHYYCDESVDSSGLKI